MLYEVITRFALNLRRMAPEDMVTRLVEINGRPGFITYIDGKPFNTVAFDIVSKSTATNHLNHSRNPTQLGEFISFLLGVPGRTWRRVITSYSIHYTKLYDNHERTRADLSSVIRDVVRLLRPEAQHRRVRLQAEVEESCCRITSYNVCYTKLLRLLLDCIRIRHLSQALLVDDGLGRSARFDHGRKDRFGDLSVDRSVFDGGEQLCNRGCRHRKRRF